MATDTREIPMILPVMLGMEGELPDRIFPSWQKKSMESLKSVEVAEEDGSECAVCLDELKKKKKKKTTEEEEKSVSEVKEMPCGHRFHLGCIEKWLRMQFSCPVCRYRIPEEEKEVKGKRERELWFIRVMESMDGDDDLGI